MLLNPFSIKKLSTISKDCWDQTKKMTHHLAIKLHMCCMIGNKREKLIICSLHKPYLLWLFFEYTFNQLASDCLKCLLAYTKTVEYFIYLICSSEQTTKEKPFSFHFFHCPYNFYIKRVVTAHFFGMLYYSSPLWWTKISSSTDIKILNSLFYKCLCVTSKDHHH